MENEDREYRERRKTAATGGGQKIGSLETKKVVPRGTGSPQSRMEVTTVKSVKVFPGRVKSMGSQT